MLNPNVIYRVTGRYMEGQKLIGYHLVGEDGSQAQETKERVIWLIGKGIISNMRVQLGADREIIIRGKGINLNKLPVFDQAKQQFRNNEISQSAANSKVNVNRSQVDSINQMGQYTITRRIMYKNQCLGYEVVDYSGRKSRMSKAQINNLAIQKLISNAIAHKTFSSETGEARVVLRGVGIELRNLPYLIVTDNGQVIDPSTETKTSVRSAYLKQSGMLKNNSTGEVVPFRAGDYAVCGVNGNITIKGKLDMEKSYSKGSELSSAICDDYIIDNQYSIELFGAKPVGITSNMIKSWVILNAR